MQISLKNTFFYNSATYPALFVLLQKIFLLFLLISILLLPHTLSAAKNDLEFSHLTAEDGLSLNVVTEVLQDSRGFLWFGTYNGLNRFDGYNFKIYHPGSNQSQSISSHSILSLCEDDKGNIWIGTANGLNCYNWKTEKFVQYYHDPRNNNSLSHNHINALYIDKKGVLWAGTLNGLNRFNKNKNNFTRFQNISNGENEIGLNSVTAIHEDLSGNLWLGTWRGLSLIDNSGKIKLINLSQDTEHPDLYNDVFSISSDKMNNVWIGTRSQGLYKYNTVSGLITNFLFDDKNPSGISSNTIYSIFRDSKNNLWIGTKDGLNRYDYKTDSFILWRNNPEKPMSLIGNEILSITQDRTGIIWLGTSSGVSRFYPSPSNFEFYSITSSSRLSEENNYVTSASPDKDGSIWIGTKGGLKKLSLHSNKIADYYDIKDDKFLNTQFIWSIYKDQLKNVWIGTDREGLFKFNPTTGEYKNYQNGTDNSTLSNNGVISLCEDNEGNIWAGTWWGLNCLDKNTGKFKRFVSVFNSSLIWVLYKDQSGNIWAGTDRGLYKYNRQKDTFESFARKVGPNLDLSKTRIISIGETRDGTLWFGTFDGLVSFNPLNQKLKLYNQENDLLSPIVNSILEDNSGNVWLNSDKGISKLNRKTGNIKNYNKRDGLKDIEFSPRAAAIFSNGRILFGSKKGITIFSPEEIKEIQDRAPVVLTDFKIYNQSVPIATDGSSVLNQSITCTKEVEISYNNEVITIDFALLDYYNIKSNSFSYKLSGFEMEWNEVGSRNSATYTNLPPGEYTFMVMALNNKRVISDPVSLKIVIVPAFYQTVWFKLILGLGIILSAVGIVNVRTRSIRKRNLLLERRISERTRVLDKTIANLSNEVIEHQKAEKKVQASLEEKEILLKEIHHRVKNNLQVISSLLYLQSTTTKDVEVLHLFEDSQNRIKSMALIHEKLYQSKDFAEVNFGEYVKSLLDYLNRSFRKTGLNIKSIININNINLGLDTAISCGLVVNELFTNAYKYAFPADWVKDQMQGTEFIIEITMINIGDNQYQLCVRDNGIGIPSNLEINKCTSLGLKLVNSMIRQLDGSIEFENKQGTKFKILFTDIK